MTPSDPGVGQPVQLNLSEQSGSTKLVWNWGDFQRVYCVNKGRLQDASVSVREVLRRIATDYRKPSGDYRLFFGDLVAAGEELKSALFTTIDGQYRQEVLTKIVWPARGCRLRVFSDATVQVPWNFVFLGDACTVPPPRGVPSDFDDFWTSWFRVNVRYLETDFAPDPISRNSLRTLLALHGARFQAAAELLSDRPDVMEMLRELLAFREGAARDWDDCRAKWNRIQEQHENSIFYIFAHRDSQRGELFLQDEGDIPDGNRLKYVRTSSGFLTLFRKLPTNKTSTLCFINGCRTAGGELGQEFLSMTSYAGFQGFIGSEAEIAEKWATAYAVQFLHRVILGSLTVQQAYDEMRLQDFPHGLWYSCCAYPEFRVLAD